MSVVIKQCSCVSEYQDKTYGKGMRVYNTGKEGKSARCSTCGHNIIIK